MIRYYRTKDELLSVIIDWKLKTFNQMFKNWEETIPVPIERIKKFVQYFLKKRSGEDQFLVG